MALYEKMADFTFPVDGSASLVPQYRLGHFCLAGIDGHKRIYEQAPANVPAGRAMAA